MAKRAGILLIIAGALVLGLIGFLYFSKSGMTIEKFQDVSDEARAAKAAMSAALAQVNQDPTLTAPPEAESAQAIPQKIPQIGKAPQAMPLAPQAIPSAISQAAPQAFGQAIGPAPQAIGQAIPSAISQAAPQAFGQAIGQAPSSELIGMCGNLGSPATLKKTNLRAFSQVDCESGIYGAKWIPTAFDGDTGQITRGICVSADNKTNYSSLCSFLNNQAPVPVSSTPLPAATAAPALPAPAAPVAPVPTQKACNSLYPPPPPSAQQCGTLYPVTLQQCASQFSCQTTLGPIGGSTSVTTNSTPAAV
jgi:hypothetical protein